MADEWRARPTAMMIGVDFDNTIAMYHDVAEAVAVEMGMTSRRPGRSIKQLRDELRNLPGGDDNWQVVQAEIYGPRIEEAVIAPGVGEFFELCRERKQPVVIVSHKTRYAGKGDRSVDLRQRARWWMKDRGLFGTAGPGVDQAVVFFESTRSAKARRIGSLGCTHFIDDLPEVFADPGFPAGVHKLLYAPEGTAEGDGGHQAFRSWWEITDHLFQD